jgi:hypothetical protein
MNRSSAVALGASLLAFTLPNAAQASTLGGLTEGLGSAKLEAKVQVNGPVDAKAVVEGKVKAKHGRAEATQKLGARDVARLQTTVRAHVPPVRAEARVKARVDRSPSRGIADRTAGIARRAAWNGRQAVHTVHEVAGKAKHRHAIHRARGIARSKAKRVAPRGVAPHRRLGEPLAGVGREVGNPLQAGLAGGLLLGLAGLAASLGRFGVRRSLR